MLFVSLQAGPDRYALPASSIVEILPYIDLRALALNDPLVAGVFQYHQEVVPVIDLHFFFTHRPAEKRRSTRIVLIQLKGKKILGLLAEGVTQTLTFEEKATQSPSVDFESARHLGAVIRDEKGYIQILKPEFLVPAQLLSATGLSLEPHASPAI
ncbi:MAG: cheW [Verrucomicrobiales bacterium]|nr:cheW [Verrucomicrobiales bacterium]